MKTARAISFILGASALAFGCSLFVGLDGLQSGDAGSVADARTNDVAPPSGDAGPPSCASGGGGTCAGGDCCESPIVPGGVFSRTDDGGSPATVSDFKLDRFKVTVGRFRAFINAGAPATITNPPPPGSGAQPKIPSSGWDPAWNASLHADTNALISSIKCDPEATWTDAVGANESLPINCIDWYLAFAFCAWDGGRLATEAEWDYAAMGGSEQRYFPWSVPPSSTTVDHTYALYSCGFEAGFDGGDCPFSAIEPPGAFSPKGDGRWGQADLVGSFLEWQIDWSEPQYGVPCDDCAELVDTSDAGGRSDRPAGELTSPITSQTSFNRNGDVPTLTLFLNGMRCARDL